MKTEIVGLYLVEFVKMTLIFFGVRVVVDWLSHADTFSLMQSLTHQWEFALVFGAIMGVIRMIKILRIRKEKAPDHDLDQ